MRKLQVVGVSSDGRQVLLATAAGAPPSHSVALDRRLERAVKGQPLDGAAAGPPALTPKQIQAQLRAGASVEQVARDGGVPVNRVERYAGPVLSEREQVLDAVREATLTRARAGRSALPLGEAVIVNLVATAYARLETAQWTAYRRDDGVWIARLDVVVRGRRRRAEWAHDQHRREVSALDTYAGSLGYVDTAVRVPPGVAAAASAVVIADAAGPQPRRAARRRRPVKRASKAMARVGARRPRRTGTPKAAAPVAAAKATKAAPNKAPVTKAAMAKAAVRKAPVTKAAVRRTALKKAVGRKAAVHKTAPRKTAVKRAPVTKAAVKKTAVKKTVLPPPPVKKAAVKKTAPRKVAARAR